MVTIKYKILIFTSDHYLVHGFIFFFYTVFVKLQNIQVKRFNNGPWLKLGHTQ